MRSRAAARLALLFGRTRTFRHPVVAVCEHLSKSYTNDTELLELVFKAVNVYFNYTGEAKCLNLMAEDGIGE